MHTEHASGHGWKPGWVTTALLVALFAGSAWAHRARTRTQALNATPAAPNARGAARLAIRSGSDGRFEVAAYNVDRSSAFEVLVGGVRVGKLTTNRGGNGKVRFRTRPRGRAQLLGFDPRGASVAVRNDDGQDVLEGTMPGDPNTDDVACCFQDDDGDEGEIDCKQRSADRCMAAGGTVAGVASCLPNPCVGTPSDLIVCCLPGSADGAFVDKHEGDGPNGDGEHEDDDDVLCSRRSQADCAAVGGSVVQATSCEPNPCAPTPPPTNVVACCVSEHDESECRVLTPEGCTARNGTVVPSCDEAQCGDANNDDHDDGEADDGRHRPQ